MFICTLHCVQTVVQLVMTGVCNIGIVSGVLDEMFGCLHPYYSLDRHFIIKSGAKTKP